MNTVAMQMSEKTAAVVSMACESLARQMMGQVDTALEPVWVHTKGQTEAAIQELRREAGRCGARFRYEDMSPSGVETREIAWDVYQTIRQWLAYRRNPDGGHTVDFHDPMRRSGERIGLEVVEGDPDPRPAKLRIAAELESLLGRDIAVALERVKAWKAAAESNVSED